MKTKEEIFKDLLFSHIQRDDPKYTKPEFDKDWFCGDKDSPETNQLRELVFKAMDEWVGQGPTNSDLMVAINTLTAKFHRLIENQPPAGAIRKW